MKSIKEKAQEWADMYPSCGMADKSFQAGANYVLGEIERIVKYYKDPHCIEFLKEVIWRLKEK